MTGNSKVEITESVFDGNFGIGRATVVFGEQNTSYAFMSNCTFTNNYAY